MEFTPNPHSLAPLSRLCTGRQLWWGTRAVKGKGSANATSHPHSSRSRALQEGQGWNQTLYEDATSLIWTVRYFNKLLWKISCLCFTSTTDTGGTQPCSPCTSPNQAMQWRRLSHSESAFPWLFPSKPESQSSRSSKTPLSLAALKTEKAQEGTNLKTHAESVCTANTVHETTTCPQKLST